MQTALPTTAVYERRPFVIAVSATLLLLTAGTLLAWKNRWLFGSNWLDLAITYAILLLGFVGSLNAVRGETYDKENRKITKQGWIAIGVLSSVVVLAVVKEYRAVLAQRKAQTEAEAKLKQALDEQQTRLQADFERKHRELLLSLAQAQDGLKELATQLEEAREVINQYAKDLSVQERAEIEKRFKALKKQVTNVSGEIDGKTGTLAEQLKKILERTEDLKKQQDDLSRKLGESEGRLTTRFNNDLAETRIVVQREAGETRTTLQREAGETKRHLTDNLNALRNELLAETRQLRESHTQLAARLNSTQTTLRQLEALPGQLETMRGNLAHSLSELQQLKQTANESTAKLNGLEQKLKEWGERPVAPTPAPQPGTGQP